MDEAVAESSEEPTAWKIILEQMTDIVVISEVDSVYVCRTKQGRKHMPDGELVGTTECMTL
jgi:hypothetical protein